MKRFLNKFGKGIHKIQEKFLKVRVEVWKKVHKIFKKLGTL